ncbi:MAG: UPF0149 family protein [Alphaproteobacteria bacterium]|nr:UPF0149 family protein [Alphaproteobacteria bacterium]
MARLPPRLRKLADELALLGDEAMVVEEFDGFVAALLVCPEMIKPSEWLKQVWQRDESGEPAFEDIAHANRLLAAVMEHYNSVARTLARNPERYAPLFPVYERTGEILWEIWIEGFARALEMKPAAWEPLRSADEIATRAISGLRTMIDVARGDPRFSEIELDALTANGPERIAEWVVTLSGWSMANHETPTAPTAPKTFFEGGHAKVGRNQACPCGSGKKYKRCHGAN